MAFRQHRWPKRVAKRYQELLGLEPVQRRHYGEPAPDAESAQFVAEYKCRERLPALVERGLIQAARYLGDGDPRIPLLILHPLRGRIRDDVVCLRVADFARVCALARGGAPLHVDPDPAGPGAPGAGVVEGAEAGDREPAAGSGPSGARDA